MTENSLVFQARLVLTAGWVDPRAVMGTPMTHGWDVSAAITDRVPIDRALVLRLEGCRCGLEGPTSSVVYDS